jgi:hypothetical protein
MALRKAAPLLFLLFAQSPLLADSVTAKERTVTKLAEGVYEIRHKDPPDHFSQGNTVVIIGDIGVLVVDSCYLPSSAREDIAQIRQWTNKPIRYLLNTHWHSDHNFGNAMRMLFPQLPSSRRPKRQSSWLSATPPSCLTTRTAWKNFRRNSTPESIPAAHR